MDYRDRTPILIAIGVLLLLAGAACAFLGPLEVYCFYLFSEGGRFHYEGFGFGSFMFGNIAVQIAGYYLIAAVLIPLGYGHLARRRWARPLSVALLWFWLVVGAPLTVLFLLILVSSKDLSPAAALIAAIALALSYLLVPALLLRFYQGRNVRRTFEANDPNSYRIEEIPMPVLVLGALFLFTVVALHVPILFNGLFPVYGTWLTGLEGIVALDVAIWCLVFLTWGTLRQRAWAWWGAVIYFGLLTTSLVVTLAASTYAELLSAMDFPPFEMEFLKGVPLQGYHLALFAGIPLGLTLGILLLSKKYFGSRATHLQGESVRPALHLKGRTNHEYR